MAIASEWLLRACLPAQVWDATGTGCIRWQAADAGVEHMGVVAENSLLQVCTGYLCACLKQMHIISRCT